jgi:selenide,water dikinase
MVSIETLDDAGIYRISDDLAMVQTVDVFPPPVHDPVAYGRIVAANAMSDVWAMGGEAKTALNILSYPPAMITEDVIGLIIQGACEKMHEANVDLMGGHTQQGESIFFGLSVTGFVHPDKVLTNASAKPGDSLILTKPLGSGILTAAFQTEGLPGPVYTTLVETMERLNKSACETAVKYDVHSMTDVTGYGLLGHAIEMAKGSGLQLAFDANALPIMEGCRERAEKHFGCASKTNRENVEPNCDIGADPELVDIASDAQTSGGLLIAVATEHADELVTALRECGDTSSVVVGEVRKLPEKLGGYDRFLRID